MRVLTDTTNRSVTDIHRLDGLLAPSGPPPHAGALAASATFGWRAMLKIKHDPKQLTDVIAIPIVFTVLFTYVFGGAIGGTPGHYLETLLPGTLVMGITAVSMYGGARLARDVTTGAFDRFRSQSIWGAPTCSAASSATPPGTYSPPPSWSSSASPSVTGLPAGPPA